MIAALVAALALSLLINWCVRTAARSRGWIAAPRSTRHIHEVPVPRLGGIGVFFSFAAVTAATALVCPNWINFSGFLWLLVPASIMFGVGIYDDLRPVTAKIKLFVQVVCGTALFVWLRFTPLGLSIRKLDFGEVILFIGTIIWVVLITNSINLIDGVDGLAGGTAVLTLAAITCVAWRAGRTEVVLLAVILIGSLLGFLRFNFNPATMFLGDGGSLFVGFMISVLGVIWGDSRTIASTIGIAVAILALPLAETGVSVIRRFISGRPLFSPDREHMHHKLLDRGLSQREAVLLLYVIAIICGLSGIAIAVGGPYVFAISFAILALILAIGLSALGYVEFVEIGRLAKRVSEQRRVIANDVRLRHLAKRIQTLHCIRKVDNELRASLSAMRFDGFELRIAPSVSHQIRCEYRESTMKWGHTAETRTIHPACWTMELELDSKKHGNLGWLLLSSNVDRGSLLFDANLLVSELQPAVVASLENCFNERCSDTEGEGSVGWIAEIGDEKFSPFEEKVPTDMETQKCSRRHWSTTQAND